MSTRKIISLVDFHAICRSREFWRGVAIGFSPQCYLLSKSPSPLWENDDSMYQAWAEVGNLLTQACNTFASENGKIVKTRASSDNNAETAAH